jgi:hypothetical protein
MKYLIRLAAHLYPRQWRERYGEEFSALLEDVGPGWRDSLDIMKGALVMQLTGWNTGRTLAMGGMLGALLAFGISFAIPKQFVSQAVIKIAPEIGASPLTPAFVNQQMTDRINTLSQTVPSRTVLTTVINTFELYKSERSRMPIEDVIEMMRKNIRILPLRNEAWPSGQVVPAFVVGFTYDLTVCASTTPLSGPAKHDSITSECSRNLIVRQSAKK